ncbi:MAG: low temperature requirement protein A [Propionibacteriaceae bacterium]|nr:low temperature requirement protein A [Propionibacteriaceae bacterium]
MTPISTNDDGGSRLLHALVPLRSRDPHEEHRVATTLELLYDLTLVIAFSVGGAELAHALASGHVTAGLAGFGFVQFSTIWAWVSYSSFASSFDTDDWGVRLAVATQMVGVLVMSTGIPALFEGFSRGWQLHSATMVGGYVVMRVALVVLWLRAARANPERSSVCVSHALWICAAQVLWVATPFLHLNPLTLFLVSVPLFGMELAGPPLLQRRFGHMSWHPHHLAERFGLLTIITLGEVLVGTASSVTALHSEHGWSLSTVMVLASGVSIALGLWWVYFEVPFGDYLHQHPGKATLVTYSHFILFASLAAIGAGLHVAALREEGESVISSTGAVLSVALPVAVFIVVLYALVTAITSRPLGRYQRVMLVLTLAALATSIFISVLGAPFAVCLLIIVVAPWINVAGVETIGHRHLSPTPED